MWVELTDGRILGIPPRMVTRLLGATPEQRDQVEISRLSLHGEALDENISIAGLIAGRDDITQRSESAAWPRS